MHGNTLHRAHRRSPHRPATAAGAEAGGGAQGASNMADPEFRATAEEARPTADQGAYRVLRLTANGWVPNNEALPVIIYEQVLPTEPDAPDEVFDERLALHGWPVQWHDSVFDYHHFHSTAHEVLAVLAGSADLMLGGPSGYPLHVRAGDALLLPAGTGHCLMEGRGGFRVAGGYPAGQQWDIRRDALTAEELESLRLLPFPASDPLYGEQGPLIDYWQGPGRQPLVPGV